MKTARHTSHCARNLAVRRARQCSSFFEAIVGRSALANELRVVVRRNVLFDMIVEDIIVCDCNNGLVAYDVEFVHNREPQRSLVTS